MTYTLKDVKQLAEIIATHNCPDGIVGEELDTWSSVFKDAKEESDGDINKTILRLFFHNGFECPELEKMIFETPLDNIPLYLTSETEWEMIVALWRLAIDK